MRIEGLYSRKVTDKRRCGTCEDNWEMDVVEINTTGEYETLICVDCLREALRLFEDM